MVTKLPNTKTTTQDGGEDVFIRDTKKLSWQNEPVVYEFTNDPALLHQYYRLREEMYRKTFQTEQFSGTEDVYDKISHILIARKGRLCIGGCRLTIREAHEEFLLPMESDSFRLRQELPDYSLNQCRHGEVSRFAVMAGESEKEVIFTLAKLIAEKAVQLDLDHAFTRSTHTMARIWRMSGKAPGVKAKILNNVDIPVNPLHPDIKWYMTVFSQVAADVPEKTVKTESKTLVH